MIFNNFVPFENALAKLLMKETFEISFDEKGIARRENLHRIFWLWDKIKGGDGFREQRIEWREIKELYVYKLDIYVVDLICLMLRTNDDESFELHEQMQGWQNLVENLPEYLPDCLPFHEWFMKVAFPAFEFNLIKIYPPE